MALRLMGFLIAIIFLPAKCRWDQGQWSRLGRATDVLLVAALAAVIWTGVIAGRQIQIDQSPNTEFMISEHFCILAMNNNTQIHQLEQKWRPLHESCTVVFLWANFLLSS